MTGRRDDQRCLILLQGARDVIPEKGGMLLDFDAISRLRFARCINCQTLRDAY